MAGDYKRENATSSESPHMPTPRLAARALILRDDRLLLVNAYPDGQSDLWCAPGGGVEKHASLPDNLIREVHEETGLTVSVGAPTLINEFHDPDLKFHQVDIYFRCEIVAGDLRQDWRDPEGIVSVIRDQRITVLKAVPSLYRMLLAAGGLRGCRGTLRLLFSGGEPLDTDLAHALRTATGARVVNQYGPAETTVSATLSACCS